MAQIQVFVSHNRHDTAFCQALVQGLRDAGADVWYDEHNMGSGRLGPTIERELRRRPVFVVVLSPDALQSQWVEDETRWAYGLLRKDPSRIMQPVTARAISEDDIWLFLQDFKRIEAGGCQPYPTETAVRHLLRALALTPAGEEPAPSAPQPSESVADLLERGKALYAQDRYAEAVPLFERATQLGANSFDVWFNIGALLNQLDRPADALLAHDRALALDSNDASAWNNKGYALNGLKRSAEALVALNQALALDPTDSFAWYNKGVALGNLNRYDEALGAFDQALTLDPNDVAAWHYKANTLDNLNRSEEALMAYNRALALDTNFTDAWYDEGITLNRLQRYEEALVAFDRALALDPKFADAWNNKGLSLVGLKRHEEALVAFDRALALDPKYADAWYNKGNVLCNLKRYEEALAAYNRGFDRNDPLDWRAHALVYRALGRGAEAEAAERRAQELGG